MSKKAGFTFVSLACGSGGSVQGLIQAGGMPRFICDDRPLEFANATNNLSGVPSQQVDFRWFYNRKAKGTEDLLSLMGLKAKQLDVLEGSVRFAGKGAASTPTQLYARLYDLFGLAKRILPKIVIAFGPADLSQNQNLDLLNAQTNVLRFANSKMPESERVYYAAFRVLNAADFGAAVSKPYTVIIGVRADVAQAHALPSDRAILSLFPNVAGYQKGSLADAFAGLVLPRGEADFWEEITWRDAKLVNASKLLRRDPDTIQWLPSYGSRQLIKLGYKKTEGSRVWRTSFKEPAPNFDFYDPSAKRDEWGLLHPTERRILTTTELAAAVGLPRGYKLTGNDYQRAAAAAASIPPALVRALADSLKGLLSLPSKQRTSKIKISSDAEKVHLAESLRAAGPKIRTYICDTNLGETKARELTGKTPNEDHFDYLFDAEEIGESFVVYGPVDPETGQRPVIGGVHRGVFSAEDRAKIVPAIKQIKQTSSARLQCSPEPVRQAILDRLIAKGRKYQLSPDKREYRVWIEAKGDKEAHWDLFWRSNPIPSATEGWTLDKTERTPTLSENFTKKPELKAVFDYLNERAEKAYVKIAPVEFRSRRKFVQSRISLEHRLGKTVFTTLAINQYGDEMPAMNFHIDNSDSDSGLTCISVFNKGHYTGGYFVLPQYCCAFKVGDGDVFVGDSRKVHGVTQIEGKGQRLSVVSYLRTDLGYHEYVEGAYPPRSPQPQFRVDRYQIGIPSYRRSETLKTKTLALLARHKIDPKRVTIFVADEAEYQIYKKALSNSPYNKLVIAVPGIIGVRNFMALYYKEGTPVLFIDDDIKDMKIKLFSKKGAANEEPAGLASVLDLERDVIFPGFNAMREHQSYIWGIYAATNDYFMKDRNAVGLYYIIASFYGTIIRHSKDLLVGTADKEDYERSVLYFIKDGRVVRLDYVTADTNYYGEKGGLQETRSAATISAGAEYMLKKYPKYCVDGGVKGKKKTREVRLRESG